ncbi:MAG TPA: cardiolipin synthase [Desulfobulbus sp.]|nr:cardiolipin synthase [Desulfobulbus sp.]
MLHFLRVNWLGSGLVLLDLVIILLLVPRIILQKRESGATLAWILTIVFIPFLGLLAFWIFGTTRIRMRWRRRQRVEQKLAHSLERIRRQQQLPRAREPLVRAIFSLTSRLGGPAPRPGCSVSWFRDGGHAFDVLEEAIDRARHHVHLCYYIWEPDRTGARMRDALVRAAGRGVEVRLLLDDVGSLATGRRFFAPLFEAGGRVARFLPVLPFRRRLTINNRNHRKIVVVDGREGFTGSMNVGDVYAGLAEPWQDLHVAVRGPVVQDLQEVFCQDWYHATSEDLTTADYFPTVSAAGDLCTQFLASGPADERWRSIHTLLFAAINMAVERIWIETPYFVPDPPVAMALQTAALRGVDVRLLLPGRSDHPLVLRAGRSFFDELLAAGVRIFELHNRLPHAKTAVIDSIFCTVGSANMDQRSFRLNFEANLFLFDRRIASQLEKDFLRFCGEATAVSRARRLRLPLRERFAEGFAFILAPLL